MAVSILRDGGLLVDVRTGLKPQELKEIVGEYDGLIVRSATKVTKEIIERAQRLKVIGRAGIGVDNIDVPAATEKGIVVMNTPQGNALAAAEHTIGLLFAAARRIPQADRSMKEGRWEKKAFMGVEIYGKTLGIVGLGNIGSIVAQKALALGMKVGAYDPFVPKEFAQRMGVSLLDLDTLLKESDFVTVHVPLLKETRNLIDKQAFSKMKDGVILINTSRGGIVNETDLLDALKSGKVQYAALDVFEEEPPPKDHPLVLSEKTICTPHLGASTYEAQDKVATDIAIQIVEFFKDGVIRNGVNVPNISPELLSTLSPYLELSSRLGAFLAGVTDFSIASIEVNYAGDIGRMDTRVLTQAALKGILSSHMEEVNYVNAPVIAKRRGISVTERRVEEHEDYSSLLEITLVSSDGQRSNVSGTLLGKKEPRLLSVNGIKVEARLSEHMLFVQNYDRPGVIAQIAGVFFRRGINIGGMHFGRERVGGNAVSLLEVDKVIEDEVMKEVEALPNILKVRRVELL